MGDFWRTCKLSIQPVPDDIVIRIVKRRKRWYNGVYDTTTGGRIGAKYLPPSTRVRRKALCPLCKREAGVRADGTYTDHGPWDDPN